MTPENRSAPGPLGIKRNIFSGMGFNIKIHRGLLAVVFMLAPYYPSGAGESCLPDIRARCDSRVWCRVCRQPPETDPVPAPSPKGSGVRTRPKIGFAAFGVSCHRKDMTVIGGDNNQRVSSSAFATAAGDGFIQGLHIFKGAVSICLVMGVVNPSGLDHHDIARAARGQRVNCYASHFG